MPVRDLSADSQGDPSRGRDRRREGRAPMNGNGVSRRFFMTTAVAAGGGLLIGSLMDAELSGATAATAAAEAPLNAPLTSALNSPLNPWIRISYDDVVTLISSQSEMGQGAMTTLPAVLADRPSLPQPTDQLAIHW